MKTIRKIVTVLAVILILLTAIFLAGRYGWKLFGFSVCESAGIKTVSVTENMVHIKGFYPGSFPQGFLGYHAEEVDGTLYVGFKFSGLFGIFEIGDFEIAIPVEREITDVIVKTRQSEKPIWSSDHGVTNTNGSAVQEEHVGWKREYAEPYTGTESTVFTLKAGDEIAVTIDRVDGRFDITIGQAGQKLIYTGNDVISGSFTVTVPEDGKYEISVSGKNAKGSVSFKID